MAIFLQMLVSGLVLGAIYAIMTVGLSLVYGSLRTLNMAQGAYVMIGGYTAVILFAQFGFGPWIGLVAAALVASVIGIATEFFAVRPLVGRKDIRDFSMTACMATIAVNIILVAGALLLFGPQSKTLPPLVSGGFTLPGGVLITWQSLMVLVISLVALGALSWFLNITRHGLSVRAVAQELDAARLVGVKTRRVYVVTMAIAAGLAGIAGVLLGPLYFVSPTSGAVPMTMGLTVAILAGIGSVRGVVYGALLIGLVQSLSATYVSSGQSLTIVFGIIMVILIVRPNGLFGLQQEERL
jgi:branched-subunit amino acid ABC-type transport system permease component